MPTQAAARHWLARWDRQQEFYLADREERFAVIADVVAATAGRPDPLVLDLGAGPGSLSVRLLERLPAATVVAVDADPLLLGLARAAYDGLHGLRLVERDLRVAGWVDELALPRPADAIVSTTALHWLTEPELAELYRTCAGLVRPGGVVVDGDHLDEGVDRPALRSLARAVHAARAERAGTRGTEDWSAWWDAVARAPELADITHDASRPLDHSVSASATVDDHLRLLRAAGFAEAGTVWQSGHDRVVVAIR